MSLAIPLAVKEDGATISAKDAQKNQGLFKCFGCGENLTLRKGEQRQHHFAHQKNSECKGGESIEHKYAKYLISHYLNKWNFIDEITGKNVLFDCHQAIEELFINPFRLDVGVLNEQNNCVAAIEVFHTHRVDDEKFEELTKKQIKVIEVKAFVIIDCFEKDTLTLWFVDQEEKKKHDEKERIEKEEQVKKQEEETKALNLQYQDYNEYIERLNEESMKEKWNTEKEIQANKLAICKMNRIKQQEENALIQKEKTSKMIMQAKEVQLKKLQKKEQKSTNHSASQRLLSFSKESKLQLVDNPNFERQKQMIKQMNDWQNKNS